MPDLKIRKPLLRKLCVKSNKERELLPPKKQVTKNQSTKISKPSKKLKTKLPKKLKRRLQEAKRNDWSAI
jgi:hypothetical protein